MTSNLPSEISVYQPNDFQFTDPVTSKSTVRDFNLPTVCETVVIEYEIVIYRQVVISTYNVMYYYKNMSHDGKLKS